MFNFSFPHKVRRFESTVRVELRIIKNKIECAVAQRPARRIEVEFGNCFRAVSGRLPILCVECKGIETLSERRGLKLLMDVSFGENADVVVSLRHSPISGKELRRISIRSDDC